MGSFVYLNCFNSHICSSQLLSSAHLRHSCNYNLQSMTLIVSCLTWLCTEQNANPFSSVQSLSRIPLFVTPWTAACQASLSITNSQSLLRLMSIESVMPSNHLIIGRSLLLLPSIFPSIRIFSNIWLSIEHLQTLQFHPPPHSMTWTQEFLIILLQMVPGLMMVRLTIFSTLQCAKVICVH